MEFNKENYSKEEITELFNQEFEIIKNDYELQVNTLNERLVEFEDLKKNNLETKINLEIIKNGLDEELFDLVYDQDFEKSLSKIQKLKELKSKQVVDNSYKPNDHKTNNDYEIAKSKGDVSSMLKSKISNILK